MGGPDVSLDQARELAEYWARLHRRRFWILSATRVHDGRVEYEPVEDGTRPTSGSIAWALEEVVEAPALPEV